MLDSRIEAIAREQTRIEFEEREVPLAHALSAVSSRLIMSGASQSSRGVLMGMEVVHDEIRGRAATALNILRRVSSEIGVEPRAELAPSMKAFLDDVISKTANDLFEAVTKRSPISSSAAFNMDIRTPFDKVLTNALSKVHTEVDLFQARVLAVAEQTKASGNQVTVTGSGNVVMTGAFAGSPITIVIDSGARSAIEKALDDLEKALTEISGSTGFNVAELSEMIAQSKAQLASPSRNSTLLTTMLVGIASTIQTTAALRPAYESLKWALLPLGITLP